MADTYAGRFGVEGIIDVAGNAQTAASVLVKIAGAGTATLYTDETKASTASNPITPDSDGNISFYAVPGLYDLEITVGAAVRTKRVQVPPFPADTEAVLYVATTGSDSNNGLSWGTPKLTIAAAVTAMPAGGGIVEIGAGTFSLGSASVGLTLSAAKRIHYKGRGRQTTILSYAGSGSAVKIDGTGTDPNDWGSLQSLGIACTAAAGTVGLEWTHVHRGFLFDVRLLGNNYNAGSRGVLCQAAYGNYMEQCVVESFETGIDLSNENHDFTIDDTNIGAEVTCVQIVNSDDVRLRGGQHSGTGSTVGTKVIATTGGAGFGCAGLEISEVHYEGNGLDIAIGRVGDGSTASVQSPTIKTPTPSGITLDRVYKPLLLNANIGDGTARVLTLTSNCSYPIICGLRLESSASVSDSSGSPTYISDTNGRSKLGAGHQGDLAVVSGSLIHDNNQAAKWKDSGGTARRTQLMTGGNAMYFGDVDNANNSDLLLLAGGTGIIKGLANGTEYFYIRGAFVDAQSADLRILTAGKGLKVAEGANAKQGVSTLVGGTVTVSTTAVTANSRIQLTVQSLGTVAAPKAVAVTARTAATSFVITSADATDTSVVAWLIVEPA